MLLFPKYSEKNKSNQKKPCYFKKKVIFVRIKTTNL